MPTLPKQWDEAGFTDQHTGKLGKPVKSNRVRVPPGLALSADRAWLTWDREAFNSKWRTPERGMLDAFVRITKPKDALSFARKWGVFGLCELLPNARESQEDIALDGRRWRASVDVPLKGEPISFWLMAAQEARAILNIAAALKLNNRGDALDWRTLGYNSQPKIQDGRFLVQSHLNEWLELGRVSFRIDSANGYDFPDWDTEVYYRGFYQLMGALAIQMVLVIAEADALYRCSGCRLPYIRLRSVWKRSPKPGQANYCAKCGRGRAVQHAKKRYRRKMAEARRLHAEGVAAGEIAKRLDTRPVTVRGWIKKAR